jgi:hypothetical protein
VPALNAVAGQWVGSRFCARDITRNLNRVTGQPFFWTREKRGEEAASWLFWRQKLEYLRQERRECREFRLLPSECVGDRGPERQPYGQVGTEAVDRVHQSTGADRLQRQRDPLRN